MNAHEFLTSHGFIFDGSNREEIADAIGADIQAKLDGRPSSLRMLPSCIACGVEPRAGVPTIAIDAGGTNLRVASVTLSADGAAPSIRHLRRAPMPGTRGPLSADAFHAAIAREADVVFAAEPLADRLGYCFSYECRALPSHDVELLAWSKEIAAPEVVGQQVGAELVRRLARKPSSTFVLNDTVATLLAGRAKTIGRRYSGFLGFILGTGVNVACVEDGEIRNAESGEFNRLARSAFDVAFDRGTSDPGSAVLEKMTSGGFLGGLGLLILKAAADDGFFVPETRARLAGVAALETPALDAFVSGPRDEGNPLASVFAGVEAETARALMRPVFMRSAMLAGVQLAAFLRRCVPSNDPVLITVDGSTFYKTRSVDYRRVVSDELARLAPGRPFEFVQIEDASLIGAAIAALGPLA